MTNKLEFKQPSCNGCAQRDYSEHAGVLKCNYCGNEYRTHWEVPADAIQESDWLSDTLGMAVRMPMQQFFIGDAAMQGTGQPDGALFFNKDTQAVQIHYDNQYHKLNN